MMIAPFVPFPVSIGRIRYLPRLLGLPAVAPKPMRHPRGSTAFTRRRHAVGCNARRVGQLLPALGALARLGAAPLRAQSHDRLSVADSSAPGAARRFDVKRLRDTLSN